MSNCWPGHVLVPYDGGCSGIDNCGRSVTFGRGVRQPHDCSTVRQKCLTRRCLTGMTCATFWRSRAKAARFPRQSPRCQPAHGAAAAHRARGTHRPQACRTSPDRLSAHRTRQDAVPPRRRRRAIRRGVPAATDVRGTGTEGTLRVTCPEGMASRLLAPVIELFREKYPELRVDLIMTDRRLDLTKGEAEVAVRMHEPGDDSLIARKIADLPWAVFASQSYIKRHGRPQRREDLDHHAIIEFGGEMADNHGSRWLRIVAPRATIAARGNSMLGVLAAVKSGAGLAPLPMLLGRLGGRPRAGAGVGTRARHKNLSGHAFGPAAHRARAGVLRFRHCGNRAPAPAHSGKRNTALATPPPEEL